VADAAPPPEPAPLRIFAELQATALSAGDRRALAAVVQMANRVIRKFFNVRFSAPGM